MGPAIGDILPLAVGVAISPVPIIAIVLMLATPRARANGIAFALGWVGGLAVVGAIVLLVENLKTWMGVHNAAIMTVLFLVLGVKLIGDAIAGLTA